MSLTSPESSTIFAIDPLFISPDNNFSLRVGSASTKSCIAYLGASKEPPFLYVTVGTEVACMACADLRLDN